MSTGKLPGLCLPSLLVSLSVLPLAAQTTIINESFDVPPDPADLSLVGSATVAEDGCGNNVLSLTTAANDLAGWAWFADEFDLSGTDQVVIDFDLFLGQGTTTPPADGASVIFQFDGDLQATGSGGGGLGTGNFFLGGPDPSCKDAADADDSNSINITDEIYLLNFLFLGGPPPEPPHPGCGPDPDDDPAITCVQSHEKC